MSRHSRVMGLTAAIETNYGVDATPDPATNAILTKGMAPSPYQGDMVQRGLDRPTLGGEETINANPYSGVSFDVELAGSGAAGTVPAVGILLRACAFSETIDLTPGSESVVYAPVTNAMESATLYFYRDGELHKMRGARGTFSLGLSAKGIPTLSFNFTGLYARPETVAVMPTFNWDAFKIPLPVTKDNTPTFKVHGYDAMASDFSVDMGLSVVPRNLVGLQEVAITDRGVSGSFAFDAPDLATKNFFEAVESHNGITTGAVKVVHGVLAGNVVQIDAPKVQLTDISHGESDGVLQYSTNASYIPVDGDDEILFTFK